jgi:hypothetical protein
MRNMVYKYDVLGSQALSVVSGSINRGRGKMFRSGWCMMEDLGLDSVQFE